MNSLLYENPKSGINLRVCFVCSKSAPCFSQHDFLSIASLSFFQKKALAYMHFVYILFGRFIFIHYLCPTVPFFGGRNGHFYWVNNN